MRNTLREFLKLSRPLHSVSVVAKQAPLALSNAKVSCKHGLWLVARVNKKSAPSELYGYSTNLRSMTGGRGTYSYMFDRYEQAPSDVQERVIADNASEAEE